MFQYSKNQKERVDQFSFQNEKVTRTLNVIQNGFVYKNLIDEVHYLKQKYSSQLKFGGHSTYDHVLPNNLVNEKNPLRSDGKWNLIEFYQSKEMLQLVSEKTGFSNLKLMEISNNPKFEINCKLNFYTYSKASSGIKSSKLGWHFDRTDQVSGNVVVVVLTLLNEFSDWATEKQQNASIEFLDQKYPTLSFFPYKSKFTKPRSNLCSISNSATIHDPRFIFHKANPLTLPNEYPKPTAERIIFVMKYCTDATPMPLLKKIQDKVGFAGKHVYGYLRLEPVLTIILPLLLLIVLFVCIISVSIYKKKNKNGRK